MIKTTLYSKLCLQPSLYPGNCWAMEGQSGHATIKLREEVVVTGVTIDHIPQELSPNGTLDTAPKDFTVKVCEFQGCCAWIQCCTPQGYASLEEAPVSLGKFTYALTGSPVQEFNIDVSPFCIPMSTCITYLVTFCCRSQMPGPATLCVLSSSVTTAIPTVHAFIVSECMVATPEIFGPVPSQTHHCLYSM